MGPVTLELKPDRSLLDSNFDGYKLSLHSIPCFKKTLATQVDRILLNSSQYTLLHAKLFGLHNHLIGDSLDENDSVYFVDKEWHVCKIYVDPFTNELIDPIRVWQIPKRRDRNTGDYNVSMKFVNSHIAVLSDGAGMFYILETGPRNEDTPFTMVYSDEIISNHCQNFIISDAVYKETDKDDELHVLLLNIQQDDPNERFLSVIHWVSFTKKENGTWGEVSLRQLKTKGDLQYLRLEKSCEAVYVVSDKSCYFTLNSEQPIEQEANIVKKTYSWSQSFETITIRFPLPGISDGELVEVKTLPTEIDVVYAEEKLLFGMFYHRIIPHHTRWIIENNTLVVVLVKGEIGLMWPELVPGDQKGEYRGDDIIDSPVIQQVHERLENLTSETEAVPQGGTTFNSQQVEECDFENDKTTTFERLSGTCNEATHRIHLGSHQVVLTANLNRDLSPAIGIRHDVDICLWQPVFSNGDFSIKHDGTLLAFGYVQASKQNRKFCVCPPDMSYSVVCESTRHLFVYHQNKPVSSGELKNRTTGRRVHNTAQQQVVNIPDDEVIGIYAGSRSLFLLGEEYVMVLKVND